jgi:peptidoglycan/xylan/chitin deacetylase (PgdA/CDA1 family)
MKLLSSLKVAAVAAAACLWLMGCNGPGGPGAGSRGSGALAASPAPRAAAAARPAAAVRPAPPRGPFIPKLIRGDSSHKWVAITIDDGPHPAYTPRLLAELKQANVHATFFVVGMMAAKYPDLIKAEAAAGHQIGTHSYTHPNLRQLSAAQVKGELAQGADVITRITGKRPDAFRPPYGFYNDFVLKTATSLGLTLTMWSVYSGDSAGKKPAQIQQTVFKEARNGSIILLHDGFGYTPKVLPALLEGLKRRGFQFVTIDQLIAQEQANRLRHPAGPAPPARASARRAPRRA